MKPKNRIYCSELGRSKMVFETEKKALTFIKFNADELEETTGTKPQRAYYCECCGGWHVTSMSFKPRLDNRVQKTIDLYESHLSDPDIPRLAGVIRAGTKYKNQLKKIKKWKSVK